MIWVVAEKEVLWQVSSFFVTKTEYDTIHDGTYSAISICHFAT